MSLKSGSSKNIKLHTPKHPVKSPSSKKSTKGVFKQKAKASNAKSAEKDGSTEQLKQLDSYVAQQLQSNVLAKVYFMLWSKTSELSY